MPLSRRVTRRLVAVLCFSPLVTPLPAEAQADATPALAAVPTPARFTAWFSGAYGWGVAGQDDQTHAVSFNLSAQHQRLLVSVRAAGVSSSIFDSSWDVGLLAGAGSSPARRFHVGAAIGLGAAHMARVDRRVLTVPAEAQLSWRFSRFVGLGLYGFASLNSSDSFGGVALAFQLGLLR